MANRGKPNTNSSQFFITTVPCMHLNGINVVFGKVLRGLKLIIEMEKCQMDENNMLLDVRAICAISTYSIRLYGIFYRQDCVIEDCGEFRLGESWNLGENDIPGDVLPPYPEDLDIPNADVCLMFFCITMSVCTIEFFRRASTSKKKSMC